MYSSTTTRSTLALALLLSTTASAYTLSNVTIGSADPSIQYYSPCVLKTYEACGIGSWYESHDERFYGGSAMIATDPSKAFGDVEPYLAYTFKGSALYMYQWVNSSTAVQLQYYDNNRNPQIDLAQEFPQDTQSGDLVKVLAWSLTGLDPLKEHTVGIQHQARIDGPKTQLVFDYMVVTMTTLDASDMKGKKKLSGGAIAGAVIGGLLGVLGLIGGFFVLRRWCNKRADSKSSKAGRWTWEGSFVKPTTLKFNDPSSEIEASERMAREGRIEEEEVKTGPLAV